MQDKETRDRVRELVIQVLATVPTEEEDAPKAATVPIELGQSGCPNCRCDGRLRGLDSFGEPKHDIL